jgi:hypothetical protein
VLIIWPKSLAKPFLVPSLSIEVNKIFQLLFSYFNSPINRFASVGTFPLNARSICPHLNNRYKRHTFVNLILTKSLINSWIFIADELIETLHPPVFVIILHIGYRRNSTTNSKRNIDRSATSSRTKLTDVFFRRSVADICLKHQFVSPFHSSRSFAILHRITRITQIYKIYAFNGNDPFLYI